MCHSVDMYMPQASRRAAEERIREANIAAAERERLVVAAVAGLAARLRAWLTGVMARGLARRMTGGATQEQARNG